MEGKMARVSARLPATGTQREERERDAERAGQSNVSKQPIQAEKQIENQPSGPRVEYLANSFVGDRRAKLRVRMFDRLRLLERGTASLCSSHLPSRV